MVYLLLDLEYVVAQVEAYLAHRTFHVSIALLEHDHGDIEVLPVVYLLVHYESVEKRILAYSPKVRCNHDSKMAYELPLLPLRPKVFLYWHDGNVQRNHIHCVIALVHYVWNDAIHWICIFDPSSVFSLHLTFSSDLFLKMLFLVGFAHFVLMLHQYKGSCNLSAVHMQFTVLVEVTIPCTRSPHFASSSTESAFTRM